MSQKNETNSNQKSTTNLASEVKVVADREALLADVNHRVCSQYAAAAEKMTPEELDNICQDIADRVHIESLAQFTSEITARKTLGAVNRVDWWVDKIFSGLITTTVGLGIMTAVSYLVRSREETADASPLPEADQATESPFANPAFTAPPRPLRGKRVTDANVAQFNTGTVN